MSNAVASVLGHHCDLRDCMSPVVDICEHFQLSSECQALKELVVDLLGGYASLTLT